MKGNRDSKRIRTGIAGAGFIGPVHIEALRRLGFVDVVALTDVSMKIAEDVCTRLSVPRAYDDYERMLNESEIDVVHICTPNHLHYPMAEAAILAGKHVVCDKPLAMNSKQGRELIALAKKHSVLAACNFNIRYYPLIHQIKDMIVSGKLGRIMAVTGSYEQDWLQKETDYNWRLETKTAGQSRAVADIGSHWLDCAEFMTGLQIKKVFADFATFHPIRKKPAKPVETYSGKILQSEDYVDVSIHTEDYATVLLRFDNDAHGTFTVNQAVAGRKNRICFEIAGSEASVFIDTESPNELWIGSRDNCNMIMPKDPSLMSPYARTIDSYPGGHQEGFGDTFKQAFSAVYNYLCTGMRNEITFPTFEDGYRDLLLIEKIVESAKSGAWVEV
jgi:predicted dehydrogenase